MAPNRNAKGQKKKVNRTTALAQASEIEGEPNFEDTWQMYNLDMLGCLLHGCPNPKSSNCRQHPFCLSRIGIEKFEKLIKSSEVAQTKLRESIEARDMKNQPCGLVNSGNFCYVNSFLQIFYNDLEFRQIVYEWVPVPDWKPPENSRMNVQTVMNALQKLFYHMLTTPFDDCETVDFTTALALRDEQQDPSELGTLFFQALERHLPNHPNGMKINERINRRFFGTMQQRMVCICGRDDVSTVNTDGTLSLSIEKAKTLSDMFRREFSPIEMTDFVCGMCGDVGTTTKHYGFGDLPTVLRITLNRYTYISGDAKKLKNPIQFSRELSGSTLKPGDPDAARITYDLEAVMVHVGEQTYCGHYYDLVKNPENGKWYEYNDERVKEIRAPGVDREKSTAPSKPTVDQKMSYGLIYRQKCNIGPIQLPRKDLTDKWDEEIQNRFNNQTANDIQAAELGLQEVRKRQRVVTEMMDQLELKPTKENEYVALAEQVAFLPLDLLADVISKEYDRVERKKKIVEAKQKEEECDLKDSDEETSPSTSEQEINGSDKRMRRRRGSNSSKFKVEREKIAPLLGKYTIQLCGHGKLQFEQVANGAVKAVSSVAADNFLRKYGIQMTVEGTPMNKTPRGYDICVECVKQMQREADCVKEMAEDEKLATKILKEEKTRCSIKNPNSRPPLHMYISKKALQKYKSQATKEIEYQRRLKENTTTITFFVTRPMGNGFSRKRIASESQNGIGAAPIKQIKKVDDILGRVEDGDSEINQGHKGKLEKNQTNGEVASLLEEIVDEVNRSVELQTNIGEEPVEILEIIGDDESPGPSNPDSVRSGSIVSNEGTSEQGEGGIEFNSELRCEHGGVNLDEFRLSVTPDEWNMLSKHFVNKFSVPCDSTVCEICVVNMQAKSLEDSGTWEKVKELYKRIGDLIRNFEKRNPPKEELGLKYTHLICNRFLKKVSSLVRSSKSRRGITMISVCQDCVLCHHGKPYINANEMEGLPYLVPITSAEWNDIAEVAKVDTLTSIKFMQGEKGDIEDFCFDCHESLIRRMEESKSIYQNAFVYVKLAGDNEIPTSNGSIFPSQFSQSMKVALTRRTAAKSLLRVRISSDQTIRDMKVKLYSLTKQTPSDQLIYKQLGSDALEDYMTLESARVLPDNEDNPLVLVVQSSNVMVTVDENKQRELERGFEDTALSH